MSKYQCRPDAAERIKKWLAERGGIAVWQSIWLTDPGASWTTPALTEDGQPYPKPIWKADDKPERIVTDPAEVEVVYDREVKRFHVGTRLGGTGLYIKVTDAGSARIHREVEKAGEGAYYAFDYFDYRNCVILAPERIVPLLEFVPDGK